MYILKLFQTLFFGTRVTEKKFLFSVGDARYELIGNELQLMVKSLYGGRSLRIRAVDGDVYARHRCRVDEIDVSLKIFQEALRLHQGTPVAVNVKLQDGHALGCVESWRGEILTVVHLKDGKIERCMPRDPSICNWALFGELAPGNIVPDFPLCNKSLNLSYSGNDL